MQINGSNKLHVTVTSHVKQDHSVDCNCKCILMVNQYTLPVHPINNLGILGLRVPRSECPPACKLLIRVIAKPYRFIPFCIYICMCSQLVNLHLSQNNFFHFNKNTNSVLTQQIFPLINTIDLHRPQYLIDL